jgi:hypothetical protein
MIVLRFLLMAFVVALGMSGATAPAHAQLFGEPRYYPPGTYRPPPQRRLPGTDVPPQSERQYMTPRRQYVPEQRAARPRQPSFFERLFGRSGGDRRGPPPEQREQREQREQQRNSPGGAPDNDVATPAAPRVPKTIFVAVLGDSLAENIAPGLSDALSERPEVGLVREIRSGQGFLKDAKKTWRMSADEILARSPPVAAAVIFLGPMDDPPPAKKKKTAEADVPALATAAPWMDTYASKVDDIALAFRQKGIPLLWVGLPPVEDEKVMADYLFLNDLIRQRVAALGGTFIDVWEGFVNAEEDFIVQGPDIEGRVVRLRTADGVHFTRAGARKLGHYIELELRTILAPKDQGDSIADLGSAVDPGAPTVPGSSRILLLGQAPRTPGAQLVPPAAAPAQKKAPEFNPGIIAGQEGTAPDPAAAPPEPPKPEANALVTGTAVPAKPGRADDFKWPATAAN